jgi:DNA-binding NtrC family response regulator
MNDHSERIASLCAALTDLLHRESEVWRSDLDGMAELARGLSLVSRDQRLVRLARLVKGLSERSRQLPRLVVDNHLASIRSCASTMGEERAAAAVGSVLLPLLGLRQASPEAFCGALLDGLLEETGAERGYIVFAQPSTSEVAVACARNFETENLALEEYQLSRTVLRRVLSSGCSEVLDDVSTQESFADHTSVRRFNLRSVLAVPLRTAGRTVGAVYLEDSQLPGRFGAADVATAEAAAAFAVFYLEHAHLLPVELQREHRVYLDSRRGATELVGEDPQMRAVMDVVDRVADSPAPVLILGESGTGKELVARALHFGSCRSEQPFVAVNCAAIPDSLVESELFGYEAGAFTGARQRYLGRIEQAGRGTLLLDEISELPPSQQSKLLRVLQANEFTRLGGAGTVSTTARVVAATSKDLRAEIEAGRFSEALFYRLHVIPVELPPLRRRRGDIRLLVDHFLSRYGALYGREAAVDPAVYGALERHPFPGNVRELENLIHRLVALAGDGVIRVGDLPPEIAGAALATVVLDDAPSAWAERPCDFEELERRRRRLHRWLADQEGDLAEAAVQDAGGNVSEAARRLGIHRVTLHRILARRRRESN